MSEGETRPSPAHLIIVLSQCDPNPPRGAPQSHDDFPPPSPFVLRHLMDEYGVVSPDSDGTPSIRLVCERDSTASSGHIFLKRRLLPAVFSSQSDPSLERPPVVFWCETARESIRRVAVLRFLLRRVVDNRLNPKDLTLTYVRFADPPTVPIPLLLDSGIQMSLFRFLVVIQSELFTKRVLPAANFLSPPSQSHPIEPIAANERQVRQRCQFGDLSIRQRLIVSRPHSSPCLFFPAFETDWLCIGDDEITLTLDPLFLDSVELWMKYHPVSAKVVLGISLDTVFRLRRSLLDDLFSKIGSLELHFPIYVVLLSSSFSSSAPPNLILGSLRQFSRFFFIGGVDVANSLIVRGDGRSGGGDTAGSLFSHCDLFSRVFGLKFVSKEEFCEGVSLGNDQREGITFSRFIGEKKRSLLKSIPDFILPGRLCVREPFPAERERHSLSPIQDVVEGLRRLGEGGAGPECSYVDSLSDCGIVMSRSAAREYLQSDDREQYVSTPSKKGRRRRREREKNRRGRGNQKIHSRSPESERARAEARERRHQRLAAAGGNPTTKRLRISSCPLRDHQPILDVELPKGNLIQNLIGDSGFFGYLSEAKEDELVDVEIGYLDHIPQKFKIYSKLRPSDSVSDSFLREGYLRQEISIFISDNLNMIVNGAACTCTPRGRRAKQKRKLTEPTLVTCVHICALLKRFQKELYPGYKFREIPDYQKWKKSRRTRDRNRGLTGLREEAKRRAKGLNVVVGKKRRREEGDREDETEPPRKRQRVEEKAFVEEEESNGIDNVGDTLVTPTLGVNSALIGFFEQGEPAILHTRSNRRPASPLDDDDPAAIFFPKKRSRSRSRPSSTRSSRRSSTKSSGASSQISSPRKKQFVPADDPVATFFSSSTSRTKKKRPAPEPADDDEDDVESLFLGRKRRHQPPPHSTIPPAVPVPPPPPPPPPKASRSEEEVDDDEDDDAETLFFRRPNTELSAPASMEDVSATQAIEDLFFSKRPTLPARASGSEGNDDEDEDDAESVFFGSSRKKKKKKPARTPPPPPPPPPALSDDDDDDDTDDPAALFFSSRRSKKKTKTKKKSGPPPLEVAEGRADAVDAESLFFSRRKKKRGLTGKKRRRSSEDDRRHRDVEPPTKRRRKR